MISKTYCHLNNQTNLLQMMLQTSIMSLLTGMKNYVHLFQHLLRYKCLLGIYLILYIQNLELLDPY